jgi:Crp-like helix-turn-helix domain
MRCTGVEARLCRWHFGVARSRPKAAWSNLTQEFLSHMLGIQRSSVSLVAHGLQEAGLMKYARGRVSILDRVGIKECACEMLRQPSH